MTRVAYLDCVGGLAGDMLLAALLDAGAELQTLRGIPRALGIDGVEIDAARVERQGIGALHLRIEAADDHDHRRYADIRELVETADLPAGPRARALAAFRRLAETEGIIPALEPAHALAKALELEEDSILVCLSGRGDKDLAEVSR